MLLKSAAILGLLCLGHVYGTDCPTEFVKLGQMCYSVHNTTWRNWYKAITYCVSMNAELLTIESEQQLELLSAHLNLQNYTNGHHSSDSHYFWTAGTNLGKEKNKNYYWQTTGKDMTYAKWSEDEPNFKRKLEHCAELWPRNGNYELNDAPCEQHNMFICQRDGSRIAFY